jgi:streptogramin lyase
MTPDELAAALRAGGRGNTARLAAVDLLVWHEYWIWRMAFHPDRMHVDRHGDVDWVELANAVVRDELHASTSELKILSIACSLVGTLAVDLRECLTGLGPTTLRAVLAAMAQANGNTEVFPNG